MLEYGKEWRAMKLIRWVGLAGSRSVNSRWRSLVSPALLWTLSRPREPGNRCWVKIEGMWKSPAFFFLSSSFPIQAITLQVERDSGAKKMSIKWREKSKGFFASGALGENFCWLETFMDTKAFHAHWLEWIWGRSPRWDTLIGWEGMTLLTGSLQCKQWNDFKSFCTGEKIGMGHFPLAVVRGGGLLTGPPTRQAFVSSEERELGAQGQGVADATW